ncbi:hypothetical protein Athai_19020 [Actinocatenispora thailandica]|uniref:DUF6194 domain-containing protein n=1 Tax=Actinocatenispora thailandica TaxID=227318 RepID=A0A7R7HWV8_9ACTN|nr:DUF6194 family protein [Actinocatenispora thailandica]BCJ34399.1 hypothetical protein Athai_19020 [Actinocatenispora thailandica]
MSMDRLLETIRGFDGVLELAPAEGSAFPELAWGDHFFYYAPDGRVPRREQPYATIVTKNYPDDDRCDLDRPDRWRLNIHVGTAAFVELIGENPRTTATPRDHTATDVVIPHPVYRAQGWVSIVNPAARTTELATRLLRQAHDRARHRAERRNDRGHAVGDPDPGGDRSS